MVMEKIKKLKRKELDLQVKVDLINQLDKSGISHWKLAEEFWKTQVIKTQWAHWYPFQNEMLYSYAKWIAIIVE